MYILEPKEGYVLAAFLWTLKPFVKDQLRYASSDYTKNRDALWRANQWIGQAAAPYMTKISANQ